MVVRDGDGEPILVAVLVCERDAASPSERDIVTVGVNEADGVGVSGRLSVRVRVGDIFVAEWEKLPVSVKVDVAFRGPRNPAVRVGGGVTVADRVTESSSDIVGDGSETEGDCDAESVRDADFETETERDRLSVRLVVTSSESENEVDWDGVGVARRVMEAERLAVWVREAVASSEKERDAVSEADSETESVEDFEIEAEAETSAVGLRVGVGGGVTVGVTVIVREEDLLAVTSSLSELEAVNDAEVESDAEAEPRDSENVDEKLGVMVLLVVRSSEKDFERDGSLESVVVTELV